MSKILFLVHPSQNLYLTEQPDHGSSFPFIGMMVLSALTRDRGYETSFLDALALNLSPETVLDRVADIKPDYVGLSATTFTVTGAVKTAEQIKQRLPECTIILGGPHVTAVPRQTMERFSVIDVGVIGEGEETLLELLRFYDHGEGTLDSIAGITYLADDGSVKITEQRPLIKNLDDYPLPAWDLLPDLKKHYRSDMETLNRLPAVHLMVSRGCPMKCTFCYNRCDARNRHVRWYSIDRIMKEIEMLVHDYGVKEINFLDDNMLTNKKRMRELCHRLIDSKLDLTWTCFGSVHFTDKELFDLMVKAGCWQIGWGIEHARQEILDLYNKNVKVAYVEESLILARKAGLKNRAFIMHGNFLETRETIEDNINFLKKLPLHDFHASYFKPLPGTVTFEQVDTYGTWLRDPNDWDNFGFFERPVFLPNGLTEEEVVASYRRMYREFYLRPRIFWYQIKKMILHPTTIKPLFRATLSFFKTFLLNITKK